MRQDSQQVRQQWLAQFEDSESLVDAVKSLRREQPNWKLEAYTPFPVEGLPQALQLRRSPMPAIIFCGGVLGGASIYGLQYWVNLYAYPLNIGGRPLHSWPSFIPPTFEGTVMGASLFAIVGLMLVCGLPRLHHPIFEFEAFRRGSSEDFFLAVQPDGDTEDEVIRARLDELGAMQTWEAPYVG